jgi:hypothetical protein
MSALNKHAPPESFEGPGSWHGQRPALSRGGDKREGATEVIRAMNMGNQNQQTMQLDGQSAMLPIDHPANITNYFNK